MYYFPIAQIFSSTNIWTNRSYYKEMELKFTFINVKVRRIACGFRYVVGISVLTMTELVGKHILVI